MKRKKTQPPEQLELLDYADRLQQVVQETDDDPDYERLKAIFAQLASEIDHAESPTQTDLQTILVC